MAKYKFLGRIEAVWNKHGGEAGIDDFLAGHTKIVPASPKFDEEAGVITFTVTSNGKTGEEWIVWSEANGYKRGNNYANNYVKQLVRSSDFQPTSGITHTIKVLKGELYDDADRITKKIRTDADERKLTKPNAEISCLIREKFSNAELEIMGLFSIITMHEPISNSNGAPLLLEARSHDGNLWLNVNFDRPGDVWLRGHGFAFLSSQESDQN